MTHQVWSAAFTDVGQVTALPLPQPVREWAWGGSTGAGVQVAVVDSGVDATHPLVGKVDGQVAFEADPDADEGVRLVEGPPGDLVGHGTACAAIIRSLAPDVSLHSVRVLGANARGTGARLLAGIRWAVAAGMDVVNLSLSSRSEAWFGPLHEAADAARTAGTVLVCAANNAPGRPTLRSSPRSPPSRRARGTMRGTSPPTPVRPSTSAPGGSTSRWPGPVVAGSSPRATASPRRTWPRWPRWCGGSTRRSAPSR